MSRYFANPKLAFLFRLTTILSLSALLLTAMFRINNRRDYAAYTLAVGLVGFAICFIIYYAKGKVRAAQDGKSERSHFPIEVRGAHILSTLCFVVGLLLLRRDHTKAIYFVDAGLIVLALSFIFLFFRRKPADANNTENALSGAVLSLISFFSVCVFLGLIFKINHLPYGLYLINAGLIGCAVCFIGLGLKGDAKNVRDGVKKTGQGPFIFRLLLMLSAACTLLGLAFKIDRWTIAYIFINAGIAGTIVALIMLIIVAETKKRKENSKL